MNTFDERKKGFEAKYLKDQDAQFKIRAKRNKFVGLWAAEIIEPDNIDDYVKLAIDLAKDKSRNFDYRNTLKNAAKLYLFNDKNAVRKFEKFLLEIHEASKKNSYLKSGLTI